jgi:hypothetical protein
MEDYRATWDRIREMAHSHFPNDEVTMENATMEAFDAEQTAAYATGQDAANEEQVVLEVAYGATHLREELQAELQREAPLVDDPLHDVNEVDDVNKERVSPMSIGRWSRRSRSISTVRLDDRMAAYRMTTAKRAAREAGHHHNIEAARSVMAAAKTTLQRPGAEGGWWPSLVEKRAFVWSCPDL